MAQRLKSNKETQLVNAVELIFKDIKNNRRGGSMFLDIQTEREKEELRTALMEILKRTMGNAS